MPVIGADPVPPAIAATANAASIAMAAVTS
jgi:hypothetical protein